MYENITASFIGTGLSLLGAGILWIIKLSYDRHKNTKLACVKLERALILNLAALGENTKLIEQWILSLEQEKRFACCFSKFNTESSDLLFINELPLVNRLIKTNYLFTSIGEDIESVEKDYKDMWSALYENKIDEPTIKVYMQTLLPQIEPLPEKMKEIEKDIIKDLAHLQLFCKYRKYTLFGLIDYMNKDLFPRITESKIEKENERLKKELEQKQGTQRPSKRKICVRAVIIHEGKLLVVRHAHDASFVALPGGKLEWKEDVLTCMSRELVEELGVAPEIGRLLYINNFANEEMQSIEFFFEIKNGADYADVANLKGTHSHELSEILFISPTDDINLLPKEFHDEFKAGRALADEVRYIGSK